jgi:hypothetical protein
MHSMAAETESEGRGWGWGGDLFHVKTKSFGIPCMNRDCGWISLRGERANSARRLVKRSVIRTAAQRLNRS